MASAIGRRRIAFLLISLLCVLAVFVTVAAHVPRPSGLSKLLEDSDDGDLDELAMEDDDVDVDGDEDEDDDDDVGEGVEEGEGEGEGEDGDEDLEDDEDEEEEDEEEGGSVLKKAVSEKDVVILGSDNFTSFVQANNYVMVEFYAPWCGHCQELTPEWAAAATALKEDNVPVAKVDATAHQEIAAKYDVTGYPTLFFFVDGVHRSYSGTRTKDDIVNWVRKKIGPPVTILTSTEKTESVLKLETPTVVAYLDNVEGAEAEELIAAARQEEMVTFYMTSNADVARVFDLEKLKKPTAVLLKKEHEQRAVFDGEFNRIPLHEFVFANKLPLVINFTRETASSIFESDVKRQILLFTLESDYAKYLPVFEAASRALKGQVLVIHVNLDDREARQVVDFFGIPGKETTVMAFVAEEDGAKHMHEGAITVDELKAFGENFLAGKLRPYLKSEPIPEKNDEDVKVAVSKNFEEIVLDESKDTLLEIYAPWCGHCQTLEPIYKKLAKRLRGIESLSIVKMDGTANDHPRAKPDGFPTILFFPAGKKSFEPITFEGDRTVRGFYQFLKKNAAIPFALPKSEKSKGSKADPEIVQSSEADLKDEL